MNFVISVVIFKRLNLIQNKTRT